VVRPAEVRRVDFERIECSVCRERFVPGARGEKGRLLNEFGYRFNGRDDADLFEQTGSRLVASKALPCAKLVGERFSRLPCTVTLTVIKG
jgi:hypothetical protein